jgi:hypothetical protein
MALMEKRLSRSRGKAYRLSSVACLASLLATYEHPCRGAKLTAMARVFAKGVGVILKEIAYIVKAYFYTRYFLK